MASVAVFGAKSYDREYFSRLNDRAGHGLRLTFLDAHLNAGTAKLAHGFDAVCAFVNDTVDAVCLQSLHEGGIKLVALRSAGFNNTDLDKAAELGIRVARVPSYSPHAVAEHAVAMVLCLNRKLHRAYNKVREGNFALDGLLGFDMVGKTVGVVGTGKIGAIVCRILKNGFACNVLAYDVVQSKEVQDMDIAYVGFDELLAKSDIISVHVPLLPTTKHMFNARTIAKLKPGVMLVNTSRGPLIDTAAVIDGLKCGRIGSLGLDVYEEEGDLFFEDLSNTAIKDDVFARLLTFPNVLITGHQAFFTATALEQIASVTLANISDFFETGSIKKENEVRAEVHKQLAPPTPPAPKM